MGCAEEIARGREENERAANQCDYCGNSDSRKFRCNCGQGCCSNCCTGFLSWHCPKCGSAIPKKWTENPRR